MANLVIATPCDMGCAYCFAAELRRNGDPPFISLADFDSRLNFLQRSGIPQARFIGGEPSLHPHFPELVQRARQAGLSVIVFSHGLMPPTALECLMALPPEACTVLVNMNASNLPTGPTHQEHAARIETLRLLGSRALPGYTVTSPAFDLTFLLSAIQQSACQQKIRLGLANPILKGSNHFLHPRQYRFVGQKIASFAPIAAEAGVRLEFDCGFVRCMFDNREMDTLIRAHVDIGFHCSPIVEITTSGNALHCFALGSQFALQLEPREMCACLAADLRTEIVQRSAPYRLAGIYRECSNCIFKERDECSGGCLSHTLRRFQRVEQ
ncbi:MAG: radical SAM protein [Anaerolineales bacterium]|nr:radical SAM protein [Anaerolineales bacterium]